MYFRQIAELGGSFLASDRPYPAQLPPLLKVVIVGVILCSGVSRSDAAEEFGDKQRAMRLAQEALLYRAAGRHVEAGYRLVEALTIDNNCAPAHWQRGDVRVGGKWLALDEIHRQSVDNPALQAYAAQRDGYSGRAEWIWLTYPAAESAPDTAPAYLKAAFTARRYLRRQFELPSGAKLADFRLQTTGHTIAAINGIEIYDNHRRQKISQENVTKALKPGVNVIAVSIASHLPETAPGFRCCLDGVQANGEVFIQASDSQWKVTADNVDGWSRTECDTSNWDSVIGTPAPPPDQSADADADLDAVSLLVEVGLARWCDAHQLEEQARFHWRRVLFLRPGHEEAIKALDLTWVDHQLFTKAQVAQYRDAKADAAHWSPILRAINKDLANPSPKRQEQGRSRLKKGGLESRLAFEKLVAEPRENENLKPLAMAYIGTILEPSNDSESTQLLLGLAVDFNDEGVRRAAADVLVERDRVAFVPELLARLQEPTLIETKLARCWDGAVECTARYLRRRMLVDDATTQITRFEPREGDGDKEVSRARAIELTYKSAEKAVDGMRYEVEQENIRSREVNRRILDVLSRVEPSLKSRPLAAWWNWWEDINEVTRPSIQPTRNTTTFSTQLVRYNQTRRRSRDEDERRRKDCFAAGTLVWCDTGLRPIESIRWGDLVLSQNPETGELAYKVVLATSVRPPEELIAVQLKGETIVSTRGHRFWKAGTSWIMAKHLQKDDVLHTLRNSSQVVTVGTASPAVTYNLLIDDFKTYFVGKAGVLVHDNGIPQSTSTMIPGCPVSMPGK